MRSINKVMLYGNLTADPEQVTTKTGRSMRHFSVATNARWKDKEGKVLGSTDFHRVVAFGKLADVVGEKLKKGMPILLLGKLRNRSYETTDGAKRYVTEVIMDDFNFLNKAPVPEQEAVVAGAQPHSPICSRCDYLNRYSYL
ncbi:single-stranded DNA-binding protein [Candidatus Gracilibacteria bacterium]|nr:single-stranded DNA-binding protein [Candidatus Gracilibacteria bacterium]